jgi:hypothetical protein
MNGGGGGGGGGQLPVVYMPVCIYQPMMPYFYAPPFHGQQPLNFQGPWSNPDQHPLSFTEPYRQGRERPDGRAGRVERQETRRRSERVERPRRQGLTQALADLEQEYEDQVTDHVFQRWLQRRMAQHDDGDHGDEGDAATAVFEHVITIPLRLDENGHLVFDHGSSWETDQGEPDHLTQEQIDSIPTFSFFNAVEETSCSICQQVIRNREPAKKLPCQHIFHSECISQWLGRSVTCPVCRAPATSNAASEAIAEFMRRLQEYQRNDAAGEAEDLEEPPSPPSMSDDDV